MDFRLELHIKPWQHRLHLQQPLLLIGSCFTENIGQKLHDHGFQVQSNPAGILFNPFSIQRLINRLVQQQPYTDGELFEQGGLWMNWDFHGSFAHPDKAEALNAMNTAISIGAKALREAAWLVLTLGSAFRYDVIEDWPGAQTGQVVANCHKVPANRFRHYLATLMDTTTALSHIVDMVHSVHPACRIIFTISPVRHYREGLVENNRSKGILHNAVYAMEQQYSQVHYFPAYELVMDDLRDYRYYAEDLVHPNYAATQYVWEKFSQAAITEANWPLMQEVFELNRAARHKALHPSSEQHQAFLKKYALKAEQLLQSHPYLPLRQALNYFLAELSAGK